ncbi:hypothetical protein [Cupriavidus nantongensis]|uniref:Uncharacterized protein n=1 Tax=Cupriavidus nantongensis TaxID=1796606 RepID=A0A142JS79_9BURK|nr:hypothetical protein [Cupriavidus nantongensis]AMR80941.1 hypothetical protein A2G96_24295 [Cupriavidus nantongensis]
MTQAAITGIHVTVPGIALFGYIVIVLMVLAPRHLLIPTIRRRLYGWAAGALAGLLGVNLCVFSALMPAMPRLPLHEAFAGVCLSAWLSLLMCHRAKTRTPSALDGTKPPAN